MQWLIRLAVAVCLLVLNLLAVHLILTHGDVQSPTRDVVQYVWMAIEKTPLEPLFLTLYIVWVTGGMLSFALLTMADSHPWEVAGTVFVLLFTVYRVHIARARAAVHHSSK